MSSIDNQLFPKGIYSGGTITTDNTAGLPPVTDFQKIVKQEMKRLKRENPELHKAMKQQRKYEKLMRKIGVCPNCGRCPVCEPVNPHAPIITWHA